MMAGIVGGIWLAADGIYAVQSDLLIGFTIPPQVLSMVATMPDIPLWNRDPEAAVLVVLLSVLAGGVIVGLAYAARSPQYALPLVGLWVVGFALLLAAFVPPIVPWLLPPPQRAAMMVEDLLKAPAYLVSLAAITATIAWLRPRVRIRVQRNTVS